MTNESDECSGYFLNSIACNGDKVVYNFILWLSYATIFEKVGYPGEKSEMPFLMVPW